MRPTTFLPILLGIFIIVLSFGSLTDPAAELDLLDPPVPLSLEDLSLTTLTGLSLTRVTTEEVPVIVVVTNHITITISEVSVSRKEVN